MSAFNPIPFSSFNQLTLCIVLLVLNTTLSAQILRSLDEQVWLNQAENPGSLIPETFVGNYPVVNRNNLILDQDLQAISKHNSGTLFMVIRPQKDSLPDKRLLRLGPVSLFKDSVRVDGQRVNIIPIKDKPVIIKVQYQGRPGRKWLTKPYRIHKAIDLAEVVYYDEMLSQHQARIVESFLALKYSINITANSNPEFRNYLSLSGKKVWNVKTDSLYNQEVLGLGRMDQAGFYQSQTITADSKSIKVSLGQPGNTGEMPEINIQDSSLLVLSKANHLLTPLPCGSSPTRHLWKLKLSDWQSNAQTLRIKTDTVLSIKNPLITNGRDTYPVQLHIAGQETILTVPLTDLTPGWDYFITATNTSQSCPPAYSLAVSPCDSNLSTLTVNLNTLPAHLKLSNLTTGTSLEKTVVASASRISGLDQGQYEVLLSDSQGLILDTVFVPEPCQPQRNEPATTTPGQWVYQEIPQTPDDAPYSSPVNLSATEKDGAIALTTNHIGKSISIFPNPVPQHEELSVTFTGLEEEPFTIQVIDSKGALLKQTTFNPKSAQATWHYNFSQAGTYLLRIFSPAYITTGQIIVQSTNN